MTRALRLLAIAASVFWSTLTFASQATLVTPPPPLPMTSLASFLNTAYLSIGSCNSGTSAPANGPGSAAFAGECWINTTTNPWVYYIYDGASWVELGTLNTSTHAWTPYFAGALLGSSGAFGSLAPSPTRTGDLMVWNGSAWVTVPGNNSGTLFLQETSAGAASWASPAGSGTVNSGSAAGQIAYYPAASNAVSGGGPSNVNYTQTANGTGVSRTLQTKLDDIISAKDYGALGNGSNNDTTALNLWIAAVAAVGKCGWWPAGVYKTTANVGIANSTICIRGEGRNQTTLSYQGSGTGLNIMSFIGSSCCYNGSELSGFGIVSTTTMTGGYALDLKYQGYGSLNDILIGGAASDSENLYNGIYFNNVTVFQYTGGDLLVSNDNIDINSGLEISFDQIFAASVGNSAVHIGGNTGGIYFGYFSVECGGVGGVGLRIDNALNSATNSQVFVSNRATFDSCASGVYVDDTTDTLVGIKMISFDGWASGSYGSAGPGIDIVRWNNGILLLGGGANLINNTGSGLELNDSSTYTYIDQAANLGTNAAYGVTCPTANSKVYSVGAGWAGNGSGNYQSSCTGSIR